MRPKTLALRSVSAGWYEGRPVAGHDKGRSVSLSADMGEWVAVAGENGIGKSTLLHAIAGTARIVTGMICVGEGRLEPGDLEARFTAGVHFVPQHANLSGDLSEKDAWQLAHARRPGLHNERVMARLSKQLKDYRWLEGGAIAPRTFDLLSAILAVPRVLLLDELMPALPPHKRSVEFYSELHAMLPFTTVVLVDHDLRRAFEVAERVLWLRRDQAPVLFNARDRASRDILLTGVPDGAVGTGHEGQEGERLGLALRLDRSPSSELRLALQASGMPARTRQETQSRLVSDFPFLAWREPAEVLSGGQRVILLWVLTEVAGLGELPVRLVGHLDHSTRQIVDDWRRKNK